MTAWRGSIQLTAFSALSAVSVGSLYVTQALLPVMAPDVGIDAAAAGLLFAVVQFGYAAGLLLLVTRADDPWMRRRSMVQSAVLAAAFAVAATQQPPLLLLAAFVIIGFTATVGQSLMVVGHARGPTHRSTHRVAVITAAMLIGMFGGRILAGILADITSWRWVLGGFSVAAAVSVPLILAAVPRQDAGSPTVRRTPLRDTVILVSTTPVLRALAATQFFTFASFTAMWTVIAVHLTGPTIGWSLAQANLFGLVGLVAGVLAPALTSGPVAGATSGSRPRVLGFILLAVGLTMAVWSPDSVLFLAAAMGLITLAQQLIHAINQDRAMSAIPNNRAKANAGFMAVVFIGGTAGAALGPLAYSAGGMRATALVALAAGVGAAVVAASEARSGRA